MTLQRLVIFGASNIVSDIADAAWTLGWPTRAVVTHEPEETHPRSIPLVERIRSLGPLGGIPQLLEFESFSPETGDVYVLGPTTPRRATLAAAVVQRWDLSFTTLVHRTAYVAPGVRLGPGVFVGACSVIAPGTTVDEHVFINRGVTIGHDNLIGAFSRIQPGSALGGLSVIGRGVTVGLGARLHERLAIGDGAVIAAGAVVRHDVEPFVMVAGSPARLMKKLTGGAR
jgi:sugar O-acyltransferase (sialic acid O-acetyltransferase NeuD family)